jgi:hypothetical protein
MQFKNALGLVALDDRDLEWVTGSVLPPFDPWKWGPGKGGEVHVDLSGPPLTGTVGGSYSDANGSRIAGALSTDGMGWSAGVGGSVTSRSGMTSISGSAQSDGHDWMVLGSITLRF